MPNLSSSNTDQITKTDRAVQGNQPDKSTATGNVNTQIVSNDQLAAMAANTVKLNATNASTSPQDLALGAGTFLARLAAGNIVGATTTQAATLLAGTAPYSGTTTAALAKLTPSTGTDGSLAITCVNGLVTVITYVAPT
jgi:predicted TIM-barrel fold metal-dependent hydrolase